MRGALLFALVLVLGGCTTEYVRCTIESTPTSAEVWLGGVQRDSTPCGLLFDEVGTYDVFIKKPGYVTLKRLVTVFEDKDVRGDTFLRINPDHMTVTLDPLEPTGAPAEPAPGTTTTKPYYQ
ncbi:MAG: PEGA domain-containing protein [Planctomycetes bacterium]|nr:PEGA domain-containing protein [Planctomycetota bacterium]